VSYREWRERVPVAPWSNPEFWAIIDKSWTAREQNELVSACTCGAVLLGNGRAKIRVAVLEERFPQEKEGAVS
jgi:hypothetical protein